MHTEVLTMMAHYDRWATNRLLQSCRALREPDLDRPAPMGLGSLRRTLVHVVANAECWLDRAEGRAPPRFNSNPAATLDEIAQRFNAAADQLDRVIRLPGDEIMPCHFQEPDGSVTLGLARAAIIVHAMNHATHHHAQCLHMLKLAGHEPLPEIDFIDSVEVRILADNRPKPADPAP